MACFSPDLSKPLDVKAFLFHVFGFCGCEEFSTIITEIKKILVWAGQEKQPHYEELYQSRGLFYIVASLLDRAGLLEHGVSIRCASITESGEQLLQTLNVYPVEIFAQIEGEAYDGCLYGEWGI